MYHFPRNYHANSIGGSKINQPDMIFLPCNRKFGKSKHNHVTIGNNDIGHHCRHFQRLTR